MHCGAPPEQLDRLAAPLMAKRKLPKRTTASIARSFQADVDRQTRGHTAAVNPPEMTLHDLALRIEHRMLQRELDL
jgi:hypothetical protein